MKRRTSQGGSVFTFVIATVSLVVIFISAVYIVNQRGQQVRREQAKVASNKSKKNTTTPEPNTKKEADSATNSQSTSGTNQTPNSTNTNLPVTGSDFDIQNYLSIYLLTFALTAFVVSRRRSPQTL